MISTTRPTVPLRVLVTGGGGFLGRHLVAKLLARGDRVRVLGRRRYPDLAALGVDCRRGGIQNPVMVADACRDIDVVFHIAALADIWGPYRPFYETNVLGTLNVVAAARQAGVRKLVYCSTPSVVYKGAIHGGDESLPYPARHECAYAQTKAQAERIVLGANHADMPTCALRPHLIWGPGDAHLFPAIIQRAREGKIARVGDGKNRISVSYVENVADAHLAACDALAPDHPSAGSTYFVNDDEPVNCWDFINRVLEAAGEPPITRSVPLSVAYGVGMVMEGWGRLVRRRTPPRMTRFLARQLGTDHWFHNDRAKVELDWSPAIDPDEALRRTLDALATGRVRTFDALAAARASTTPAPDVVDAAGTSASGGGVIASLPVARGFGGAHRSAEQVLAERGMGANASAPDGGGDALDAKLKTLIGLTLLALVLGGVLWMLSGRLMARYEKRHPSSTSSAPLPRATPAPPLEDAAP